ncbi:MAG TPA: hypothetical protein DIW64_06400 [Cellvibrio sp.]|nr:hypothetical protein [Cellvibrio sp.]
MGINLYHQVGHCSNWNIESYTQDSTGDGLIFSPVHQSATQIGSIASEIKSESFLDPQYYLPSSQKKKLHTYDFFPELISSGFDTMDFANFARKSAEECIKFQLENDFDRIIIPARYFDQMLPNYTESQEVYTVKPFLEVIEKLSVSKPIFITLPLTSHMILNEAYRIHLLNWITTFPEIDGVYLFSSNERKTKQITDENYLFSYLEFCRELKEAELELVIGYLNTEGLLFSLVEDITITMGAFENTRMFSLDKFLNSDDERRGPKSRIYVPGLFNWIQFSQAKEIRSDYPQVWHSVYSNTQYGEAAFNAPTDPFFNQAGLYKDFFINYSNQVTNLGELGLKDRYNTLRSQLNEANAKYSEIAVGIDLELHGRGDHIQPWLNVINKYARRYING